MPLRIRATALMPAAVLTVHQLRYQIAFGSHADDKLVAEGHQYLSALAPVAAMVAAIAVGLFLATLARTWRQGAEEGCNGRVPAFASLWLAAAVSLLAIYGAQELLEGLIAGGHPGGLAGVFGDGGLWAIPLSLSLGALVALCLRAAAVAIRWAAERHSRAAPSHWRPAASRRPLEVLLMDLAPLAGAAAGRAPPLHTATIL